MRHLRTIAAAVLSVAAVAALLMVWNPAPAVPVVSLAASTQPYVVKLHARWCPVCMVTKDVWSEVQQAYDGRVRFVVLDFTTDATTEASRTEAKRLGLEAMLDEYAGVTGTVLVLDGVSKEVKRELHGNRDLADYRAAIEPAITAAGH